MMPIMFSFCSHCDRGVNSIICFTIRTIVSDVVLDCLIFRGVSNVLTLSYTLCKLGRLKLRNTSQYRLPHTGSTILITVCSSQLKTVLFLYILVYFLHYFCVVCVVCMMSYLLKKPYAYMYK